jgi:hypothetical protein
MRARILLFVLCLTAYALSAQPCNLSNSSGCLCADGSNDCDLLPDLSVSRDLLLNAAENPEISGELGVSVSTPNTGHGPLRVVPSDYYVCGTDTLFSPGGLFSSCPDGSDPRQLIWQRIYHKHPDGSMSYTDRWAGSMTYHPTHGHMHVDDWGIYSLRQPTADPNPLNWPIVADGGKLGFCLMDYGSCNYYFGHCRDADDNILTTDAPNYGLGGGGYSCGMTNQGISAGWTDIYYHYLEGMQIPIPPNVCNGDYMLVVQVDPNDNFLEENEDNNVQAVPITLTQQAGFSSFDVQVEEGQTLLCPGASITLSVPFTAGSYTWSTGDSGPELVVTEPGVYSVTVNSGVCGDVSSAPVSIGLAEVAAPNTQGDSVCNAGSMTLQAWSADGPVNWYDSPEGGSPIHQGEVFVTPVLTESTSYWTAAEKDFPGAVHHTGQESHTGTSLYSGESFNGYLIFDVSRAVRLHSVKVYTDTPGERIIEWRNAAGGLLASRSVNIPLGESRIVLDIDLVPGSNYQLGTRTVQNIVLLGTESPRLQRSNTGVSMPYILDGMLTIKDTNYGNSLYYYFYDWELREPDMTCASERSEVTALVRLCTGLDQPLLGASLSLAPNPASDWTILQAELPADLPIEWRVMDRMGRTWLAGAEQARAGSWSLQLETSALPPGLYLVEWGSASQRLRTKLDVLR